jgi:hypothetical protein
MRNIILKFIVISILTSLLVSTLFHFIFGNEHFYTLFPALLFSTFIALLIARKDRKE